MPLRQAYALSFFRMAFPAAPAQASTTPPRAAACWPVLGFAALAGMRSAGAPTLLSHYLVRHPAPALAASPLRLLQQPAVAVALKLAAAKEFRHDKKPGAAPRTAPRGLSLRTLGGLLVGALVPGQWPKRPARGPAGRPRRGGGHLRLV